MPDPEPESSVDLDSGESAEPEVQPELVASAPVLLTPVAIIVLLIIAIVVTYFVSQLKGKRSHEERRQRSVYEIRPLLMQDDVKTGDTLEEKEERSEKIPPFHSTTITKQDIHVVEELEKFFNHPLSLIKIVLPAIVSIALSPLVLMCHDPIVLYFWNGESRDINGAIVSSVFISKACFLSPAGLVYAVNFGFTFQSVLEKQRNILSTVSFEVGLLDQILELTHSFKTLSSEQKLEVYQIVKRNALCILREINEAISPRPVEDIPEYRRDKIWRIARILNEKPKFLRETEAVLTIDLSVVWTLVEKTSNLAKEEYEKQEALYRGRCDDDVTEMERRNDDIDFSLITE
ncbi:hypothetical protein HOLleu_18425 [Holothuria leucospilota]|uniref:Transmembrane protein n=1 Tax=Holothuria leucospilota TaxID=206669 RepID=A0A9Q1C2U5_HOLLE|nr:hypothetical protein HOLleu_18425 [Holothuria leucospilota]